MQKSAAADRLNYIDSLKGIACIIVVAVHILSADDALHRWLSGCGKIGVWLFMLSSGLLLIYGAGKDRPLNLISFYTGRILRIVPLFITALLLTLILDLITPAEFIAGLKLQREWGHFWYIPVYIGFCVISPLIILIYRKLSLAHTAVTYALIAVITAVIFPSWGTYTENDIRFWYYVPVFMMGCLLGLGIKFSRGHMLCRREPLRTEKCVSPAAADIKVHSGTGLSSRAAGKSIPANGSSAKLPGTGWLIIAKAAPLFLLFGVFGILILTPPMRYLIFGAEPSGYLQNKYLIISAFWSLIILSAEFCPALNRALSGTRILKFLGKYSYPVYLFHYIIIIKAMGFTNNLPLLAVITLASTAILSITAELMINRPLTRLKG